LKRRANSGLPVCRRPGDCALLDFKPGADVVVIAPVSGGRQVWTWGKSMKLYFAYGSNLCLKRFKEPSRVPSASFKCVVTLEGYRLVFWKRSTDGSGKATIVCDPDSNVVGALFSYEDKDHEQLKKAEAGYADGTVTISSPDGKQDVVTFICDTQKLDRTLQPYDWYLDLIRHGGRADTRPCRIRLYRISRSDSIRDPACPDSCLLIGQHSILPDF